MKKLAIIWGKHFFSSQESFDGEAFLPFFEQIKLNY